MDKEDFNHIEDPAPYLKALLSSWLYQAFPLFRFGTQIRGWSG